MTFVLCTPTAGQYAYSRVNMNELYLMLDSRLGLSDWERKQQHIIIIIIIIVSEQELYIYKNTYSW